LRTVENTFQIDRDHSVESFFAHLTDYFAFLKLDELAVARDTGVIDQDINPAVLRSNGVNPRLDFLAIDYVNFPKTGIIAQFCSQGIASFFIDIADYNFCAFGGELNSRRFTNSSSTTSNDTNFILQTHSSLLYSIINRK